ncbi:protein of unknown function [Micromonospora pallida]|uniref:DUF1707 domain-containing protein n=1 Tax=Micromonospora pallida TaxID=145854 RepID=A0A1C6RZL7_9ACTN|nr:DUF1707 domain-containing protein [Micromonospora pallida]SCL22661.1 protein of unknown function [Micromonospora pallida]
MNLHERVGNDQRAAVLELLSKALADGYLTLSEFDQRSLAVHSAVTVGNLVGPLRDLPRQFHWMPQSAPAVRHAAADKSPLALTAVVLGVVSLPLSLCGGLGGILGVAAAILGGVVARNKMDHSKGVLALTLGLVSAAISLAFLAMVLLAPGLPSA